MRVAFAPWVKGTGEKEKGVEFEVWNGGVRAVVIGAAQSQRRNIDAEAVPAQGFDRLATSDQDRSNLE